MASTQVSADEFTLDTSCFSAAIEECDNLAKLMSSLKNELDTLKNELMFSWAGDGRDMFEKKYNLIKQQLSDLHEDMEAISAELQGYESEYIQADIDLAKALDGVTSR